MIAEIQFLDGFAGFQHFGEMGERYFGITDAQVLYIGHLHYLATKLVSRQPITTVGIEIGDDFWGDVLSEKLIPRSGSEKEAPGADN